MSNLTFESTPSDQSDTRPEPTPIVHFTDVEKDEGPASCLDANAGIGPSSNSEYLRLEVRPCELKEANDFIARWHRHHQPVQGHRFSLKAVDQHGKVRGVIVIGRPVARYNDQREWVEATRLATDGTRNACSFLYAAATRVAKEMGYEKIITYTLEEEKGGSLRAVRWNYEGLKGGGDWNVPSRGGRRTDQPMGPKKRWGRWLRKTA